MGQVVVLYPRTADNSWERELAQELAFFLPLNQPAACRRILEQIAKIVDNRKITAEVEVD